VVCVNVQAKAKQGIGENDETRSNARVNLLNAETAGASEFEAKPGGRFVPESLGNIP
jgi:hypothetical protein